MKYETFDQPAYGMGDLETFGITDNSGSLLMDSSSDNGMESWRADSLLNEDLQAYTQVSRAHEIGGDGGTNPPPPPPPGGSDDDDTGTDDSSGDTSGSGDTGSGDDEEDTVVIEQGYDPTAELREALRNQKTPDIVFNETLKAMIEDFSNRIDAGLISGMHNEKLSNGSIRVESDSNLGQEFKDSMSSIYNKSTNRFHSTYVPRSSDGAIDYANISSSSYNAGNDVRNELNGGREEPDVKTSPLNGDEREYYFPRTFPNGTHSVMKSYPISEDHPYKKYLGDVFIPTSATQSVPTYGTEQSQRDENGEFNATGEQVDGAYGLHYSPDTTLGCISFKSQEDANEFSNLSDQAIDSGGKSILIVKEN